MSTSPLTDFRTGLTSALPIGLGYLAVSLAIGLYWAKGGLPPLTAAVFSATSMSSTSQFAGITLITAHGNLVELAATTLIVNLRYLLMSVSLSQRLAPGIGTAPRLLMALGVTDEVYALNVARTPVTVPHMLGSMVLPIAGWTTGTVIGALVGEIIPATAQAAAGVLLYGMFIAIVVPPARESRDVRIVIALAALVSVSLAFLPVVRDLQAGWRIIISTCVAAGIGATLMPLPPNPCVEQVKEELR